MKKKEFFRTLEATRSMLSHISPYDTNKNLYVYYKSLTSFYSQYLRNMWKDECKGLILLYNEVNELFLEQC